LEWNVRGTGVDCSGVSGVLELSGVECELLEVSGVECQVLELREWSVRHWNSGMESYPYHIIECQLLELIGVESQVLVLNGVECKALELSGVSGSLLCVHNA